MSDSTVNQLYLLNRPDIFPNTVPLYSINFTTVGAFSCTPLRTNKKMVDVIQEYKFSLKEIKMLDGTSCVGSDVINTFFNWPDTIKLSIIANELDPLNFICLKENVELFKYSNKTQLYNTDTIKLLEKLPDNIQIMYFDPPWGGTLYKEKRDIDLYLSNINVFELTISLFKSRNQLILIILKLPINYNDKSPEYLLLNKLFNIKKITDKNIVYLFITKSVLPSQSSSASLSSLIWNILDYKGSKIIKKESTTEPICVSKFNRMYLYTDNPEQLVQKLIEYYQNKLPNNHFTIAYVQKTSPVIFDVQDDSLLKCIEDESIKQYLSGIPKHLSDEFIVLNTAGISSKVPVVNFIITSNINLYYPNTVKPKATV